MVVKECSWWWAYEVSTNSRGVFPDRGEEMLTVMDVRIKVSLPTETVRPFGSVRSGLPKAPSQSLTQARSELRQPISLLCLGQGCGRSG